MTLYFLLDEEGGDSGIGPVLSDRWDELPDGWTWTAAFGNAKEGEDLLQAAAAVAKESQDEVLYFTDSPSLLRRLRRMGLPAAGYLHAGSRHRDFSGADYLVENPEEIGPDSYVRLYQRLSGQPWTIAVTDRLRIREHTPEDLDALYDLYDDPQARRYLEPLCPDRSEEGALLRAYIEKVYGLYGYGMWAVCEKESGELIGRMGFAPYQGGGTPPSFGYLIRADYRRRGMAAEAGRAVLAFADSELDFPAIGAQTASDNTASIALLRSLGFTKQSQENGMQYFFRRRDTAAKQDGSPAGDRMGGKQI